VSKGEDIQPSEGDGKQSRSAGESSAAFNEVYSEQLRGGTAGNSPWQAGRPESGNDMSGNRFSASSEAGNILNGFSLENGPGAAQHEATHAEPGSKAAGKSEQSIQQSGAVYSKVMNDAASKMSPEGYRQFVQECGTKLATNGNQGVESFYKSVLADLQSKGLSPADAKALQTVINNDVKAGAGDLPKESGNKGADKNQQEADPAALTDRGKSDAAFKNALADAKQSMSPEAYQNLVKELETQLKADPNQKTADLYKNAFKNLMNNGIAEKDAATLGVIINNDIKRGTISVADVIRK
jgi:hypothetical protein